MADRPLVAHLLRRASFGPTAAEVDAAEKAGIRRHARRVARPDRGRPGAAPAPEPDLGADPYTTINQDSSREARQQAQQDVRTQLQSLRTWWLDRMVAASHQLTEKMIFFWHGHWATSAQKVKSGRCMQGQLSTFREHGRGDFAAAAQGDAARPGPDRLAGRAAQHPPGAEREPGPRADGAVHPRHRRLHRGRHQGRRPGADRLGGRPRRDRGPAAWPNRHDTGTKTILGQTANFDADSFADLLVAQPAHPSFLARRLWYRFASGEPVPAATQARLVAAYGGGRDVSAMLRALLADQEFAGTRGQLVKQPVEWLVGARAAARHRPRRAAGQPAPAAAGGPGRAGPAAAATRRAWAAGRPGRPG